MLDHISQYHLRESQNSESDDVVENRARINAYFFVKESQRSTYLNSIIMH